VDVDECCGGGGTFFYEYPEISKKMVDKKIENAKAVKASLWLTDCPVCRMNIAGNLNHNDNLQVLHPLTLIHSALKQI
jgi:glycolate oxidase iron-sulfur subunit